MAVEPRQIYYYLVCLITLVMIIIGTVQVVNRTTDMVLPPEPYRAPLTEFSTGTPDGEQVAGPTREEREAQVRQNEERQIRESRRNAIRGLIGNITLLALAVPIYWYHWRRIRDEKAS